MTVGELIEALRSIPADREVLLSSDPEGNTIRPVYTVQAERATPDGRYWDVYAKEDYADYEDELVDVAVVWP